jgi:hypothetical protein
MPLLPTRVVGVVFVTQLNRTKNNVLILSHSWGNINILTTNKQNLKCHKEYVDLKLLPKVFQDSINITHHCGIRYLWIDSLCIVQDD